MDANLPAKSPATDAGAGLVASTGLGSSSSERTNFASMIDLLERELSLRPGAISVRMSLGIAYAQAGQFAAAIRRFDEVLRSSPRDLTAHHNRASALTQAGRLHEAIWEFATIIRLSPDDRQALSKKAVLEARLGITDAALQTCDRILALSPTDVSALTMQLRILCDANEIKRGQVKVDDALTAAEAALANKNEPFFADGILSLAQAMRDLWQPRKALRLLDNTLSVMGNVAELHIARGKLLNGLQRQTEALTSFDIALAIRPQDPEGLLHRGLAALAMGQFEQAIDAYDRLRETRSYSARALYETSVAKKFRTADHHLTAITDGLAQSAGLPIADKISLHFAAGKAFDDLGRYQEAFKHWDQANHLRRRLTAYDVETDRRLMVRLGNAFGGGWVRKFGAAQAGSGPLFVFGMPRSGTTLVEQILSVHPDVQALGESAFFARALYLEGIDVANETFDPELLTPPQLARVGKLYHQLAAEQVGNHSLTLVDKSLDNSHLAPLIIAALPQARLLHVRRNALDNALACFSVLFARGIEFSYSLNDIAAYRNGYDQLVQRWREILPPCRFLEIDYEEVVHDFTTQVRKIAEFCGLSWDAKFQNFFDAPRPVMTASAFDVRQRIYRTSVGRWRNYETELGPVRQPLGASQRTPGLGQI